MQRGDGDFLADGDVADRRGMPVVDRAQQSARFAGKLDAGPRSESEVADVLVELVGAELERELDGADIARLGECLGDGDGAEATIALVVVNDLTGDVDLAALAIDHVIGLGNGLIHRRGVGDELEDGTGLIDVADRVVAQQVGRGVAKLIGIECGTDGEGQNLAGVHVLHDDGAVERLRLLPWRDRARARP